MPASFSSAGSGTDESFMHLALQLAQRGRGRVEPNPMVGCLLVRHGQVIGQGFHQRFGGPHAEIDALQSLQSAADAVGATAYVTLEPCCHHGKTPPCSRALIDAGVQRVVAAMPDPFPHVDGGGLRQLAEAGIETAVGVLQQEATELNAPYLKKLRTGLPWVIAKWAMTIDGRIATVKGESKWITGESAREQVHRLRARVDAIAVGMGTVQADNPMLTARPTDPTDSVCRVAARVVFCRHRLPATESKLVQSAAKIPLLLVIGTEIDRQRASELQSQGAVLVETETDDPAEMVPAALVQLGRREMTNVMLEGGGELLASFFAAGQIDEYHVYLGAKVFGGRAAPGPIGGPGIERMADAAGLRPISVEPLGDDLWAVYRRSDR